MVPLNTPFDPWPWRRRVLATAAAAAALTVVIAALVTAPPDSPQGMAGPPVGTTSSVTPGTEGEGAEQPESSADPESTDPTKDDPGGDEDPDKDDDGTKPPGGDGGDDGEDPPPPPPAHVTSVSVSAARQTCGGNPCTLSASVTVHAYDKRGVTVSVTIANNDGSGSRTYTYDLSGSKNYTFSVPGDQGPYMRDWACGDGTVVVKASGSGKSASNDGYNCPR